MSFLSKMPSAISPLLLARLGSNTLWFHGPFGRDDYGPKWLLLIHTSAVPGIRETRECVGLCLRKRNLQKSDKIKGLNRQVKRIKTYFKIVHKCDLLTMEQHLLTTLPNLSLIRWCILENLFILTEKRIYWKIKQV